MSCAYALWATLPIPKLSNVSKKRCLSLSFVGVSSNSHYKHLETAGGANSLRFVLHDSLEAAGINTKHAREGREGFRQQVEWLNGIDSETSTAVAGGPDLARAALYIAAEDDSLVSHTYVPLPIEAFVERLDDLSMGFCSLYLPPPESPPEVFLEKIERYFYVHKGFRRTSIMSDARALYLHSVLTCRSGSPIMLLLIYSEMLKSLRACGFLDFDVEIYCSCDDFFLPNGYQKQNSEFSDQTHILTSKVLLIEILRNLKVAFWPFHNDHMSSLFLRAAHAANPVLGLIDYEESHSNSYNGIDIAFGMAAQHRLWRGVWTNSHFGNMKRALAACERLIMLGTDFQELRDYAVLLYHCGHYEDCLEYLKLYQSSLMSDPDNWNEYEDDAVEKLAARVNLILSEKGWGNNTILGSY